MYHQIDEGGYAETGIYQASEEVAQQAPRRFPDTIYFFAQIGTES